MTSKALTTSLAVVAVLLTTGGIAAPQVLYAREAANFHELAAQVNEEAENAAMLAMQAGSEELLLELRATEVHGLPAKLTALLKTPDAPFSADFKKQLGEATTALSSAITVETVSKAHADSAKKALTAREAEEPDPKTWFDVDADLLAFYADIAPEGVETVDTAGTVTLERVQQTKRLHTENQKLAEQHSATAERFASDNEQLQSALAAIDELATAEALRLGTASLDEIAKRDAEAEAAGLDPREGEPEETKALRDIATELVTRARATLFVVDDAGKVSGYPEGVQPAEGTMRIPGGPVVHMRYMMPKLQKFVTAYDADQKVSEEARLQAEAEAQAQAEAEAQAAQQGEGGITDPGIVEPQPGTGGQTPTAPVTPVDPTPPTTTPTPDPGGDTGGESGGGGGETGDGTAG